MDALEADTDISSEEDRIREVWNHNLEDEFKNICKVVQDYPYVALDTEFPGTKQKIWERPTRMRTIVKLWIISHQHLITFVNHKKE